jgi:hypothetical protein
MPKQPTLEKKYPTLRKPISSQQNLELNATLRKRTNVAVQPVQPVPIIESLVNNNDLAKNKRDIFPKYFASNSLTNVPKSPNIDYEVYTQNHLNDQENNFFLDIPEDIVQDNDEELVLEDFTSQDNEESMLDDFSLPPSLGQLLSDEISSDESDNSDNLNSTRGQTKYDDNLNLSEYTGDGGPYFPNVTAMWMFIWFTKNMIGIVLGISV